MVSAVGSSSGVPILSDLGFRSSVTDFFPKKKSVSAEALVSALKVEKGLARSRHQRAAEPAGRPASFLSARGKQRGCAQNRRPVAPGSV